MAAPLLCAVPARSLALLDEFFRLTARTDSAEETFRAAGEILCQLLRAEGVIGWKLDPDGNYLKAVTTSGPEWDFPSRVSLDAYPVWRDALAGEQPSWIGPAAPGASLRPSPRVEAPPALLLPVATRYHCYGCLLAIFAEGVSGTPREEQAAAQLLARVLGLQLEAQALREESTHGRRPRNAYDRGRELEHELSDKVLQREKLAMVGQLVSGIAHELNNPLTAVTGYAKLLLDSSLPPPLRDQAARLGQEADRTARIVRNLLLFARGGRTAKQLVELPEILERTLALRAYEFNVENIQVAREYADHLPPVFADPHQLQQVFLNLLLNAEQAIRSQRDRGRILVRACRPPLSAGVRVEISDDGPGIRPDLLPYIFDPFVTTKPPEQGTGLGLYISHSIVREHGGDIVVESPPGRGATFTVALPVQPRPAPPAPVAPRPHPRGARKKAKTQRILVVDDEAPVAQLVADALEQEGYAVRVFTESQRALAEALARPFDLAICDVRMPGLDGQAFYRILRQRQSPLAARLLFTTGDTLTRATAEFLERVGLPSLPKPFHVEELQSKVRELLDPEAQAPAGEKGRSDGAQDDAWTVGGPTVRS